MRNWLAPAHLALCIVILIWDVVLAGRIAQLRQAPRVFQAVSGLAALLLIPGLLLALATTTVITGRAVATMDWLWPVVLVLFAIQALYALIKRLVNPVWGFPIAAYDIVIATVGVVRYLVSHGYVVDDFLITLLAAQNTAMVFVTGTSAVLSIPFYINVPMVSPAFPALRRLTASFRGLMTLVAVAWMVFMFAVGFPRAVVALRNYAGHHNDPLRERPKGDFAVGVKILPDVGSNPPPPAIRSDFALVDTLDVDAVSVVVVPDVGRPVIDSLARVVDPTRHDSTTLIVAIGYRGKLVPELSPSALNEPERLTTIKRVMERVHPDILLPAEDPYGSGARALGTLPVERWKSYLTNAAKAAKAVDPKVKIGVSIASFSARDSALYAWAAAPGSPIDIVGFSLFPSPYRSFDIDAEERAADRWMRVTPPTKDHWVFATGGFPLAYGEMSQQRAIWQVLAWATDQAAIKGLVVYEAGDYGQSRGLRAPNGRIRAATISLMKAIQAIKESAQ